MAEKKKVSIVFEKGKEVTPKPVNGVWGGPTPDGLSIVAEFFIDSGATPNFIDVSLKENGHVNDQDEKRITRGDIIRTVNSISVMSPKAAIAIGEWLVDNGNKLLKQK